MNFNKFLQSLFGNKSSKDMKLIQPLVNQGTAEVRTGLCQRAESQDCRA